MGNLFVSHKRAELPRLRNAFTDICHLVPEQAVSKARVGDHVWLMTDSAAWLELSAALANNGVIVVVMSLAPSEAEAMQALQVGARGYLHALSPAELLQQAALVTANQGIWVPAELMSKVLGGVFIRLGGEENLTPDTLASLTERERTVALAVLEGRSNKEVARQLEITERTVKAHLGAIYRKLHVRDRMQLVLKMAKQGEDIA